jgi:hypothetical protein
MSFWATLTDWKFMPKIAGMPGCVVPAESSPSIWFRIAST